MSEVVAGAVEERLIIKNALGMHARAATKFVQTANRFRSDVEVEKDGVKVSGKSIMGVLLLVAAQGTQITVRARGDDAADVVRALRELVNARFGEDR